MTLRVAIFHVKTSSQQLLHSYSIECFIKQDSFPYTPFSALSGLFIYIISQSLVKRSFINLRLSLNSRFIFMFSLLSADVFQNNLFRKKIQEHYQSVKQFGSRFGPTFCRSRSGFKPFAKVIRVNCIIEHLYNVFLPFQFVA